MTREPEGASPAIITDHAFEPRGEWWTVCLRCKLAEAAHARSLISPPLLKYGRPA